MNNDGVYGNDAADGQAACIAHEYLCRVSVVPEEAYHGADEGADEDYQFFRARDIHDVQIAGIFDVAGYVRQYTQSQTDDGGVACCHAVHAVIQISAVGNGGHYEDCNEYEQYPSGRLGVLSHKRYEVGIVQVIALKERNGRLRSFDFFSGMYYLYTLSRLFHFDVFTNNDLRAEIQRQSYDEPQAYLADDFEFTVQTFLVFLEYLDIVVGESQRA